MKIWDTYYMTVDGHKYVRCEASYTDMRDKNFKTFIIPFIFDTTIVSKGYKNHIAISALQVHSWKGNDPARIMII